MIREPIITSTMSDFRRARTQADLEEIKAGLKGESADLICYPDVRENLKIEGSEPRGLKEIPLDAIVGSVSRCSDFTRSFLPREAIDQNRWVGVKKNLIKWSPIMVYAIDQTYFVLDGHHRVSVARQRNMSHISAYVTEVSVKVSLSPDSQLDDLIIGAEYAEFLEHTRLDELRPRVNLNVSIPEQYRVLEEHIEVHRYFMGLERQREIPYEEAVTHWYDEVYWPVVEVLRERGLLQDFPGRTETDLYLWLSEHHATLENELGRKVGPETAAADLAAQFSSRPRRVIARIGTKILNAVIPTWSNTRPLTE